MSTCLLSHRVVGGFKTREDETRHICVDCGRSFPFRMPLLMTALPQTPKNVVIANWRAGFRSHKYDERYTTLVEWYDLAALPLPAGGLTTPDLMGATTVNKKGAVNP
jgi:hypothetical protein